MPARALRVLAPKPPRVKSPCVNVCEIDEDSGFCRGCRRSLDEIAGWVTYSDAERSAVLERLDQRQVTAPAPTL